MVRGTREELLKKIGDSLRACRLQANITQKTLAERSGVSLSAVRHLEDGDGAALITFVLVCRTLGKDGWVLDLAPKTQLSPIALAEMLEREKEVKQRKRASSAVRMRKSRDTSFGEVR